MIFDIHIGSITAYRNRMINFLQAQKEANPSFTVVDVGGTAGGWTHGVADVIVDINPVDVGRYFKVNLNRFLDWNEIRDHVKENGKFSFAICSHTLEDIANPTLVMDMLSEIAEEGYIAVPSKYREFSRIEGPWLGYIHHRWIYDIRSGVFTGYPKLNFLEFMPNLHTIGNPSDHVSELNFRWKDTIPYGIVNNDYLGPSADAVRSYYLQLL